jgi:hypothetical protein
MINRLIILLIGIALVGCSETNEDVEISPVMGDVLKEWQTVDSGIKTSYYLVKLGIGLNMKINSPMSSDYNNPGEPVYGRRIKGGIKYLTDNSNDYYVVKDSGNLVLYKDNGEVEEATEVNSENSYQMFPSIKRAFKCPCKLIRDSVSFDQLTLNDIDSAIAFRCVDETVGDLYAMNALLIKETEFTEEEIIQWTIETIDTSGSVSYELKYIDNNNALLVNTPSTNAKMLTYYANESTIFITLISKDSLDEKYDDFMDSMVKY